MAEEKEVLIEVKDLVKQYGEGEATVYALNHVSMKVYKGEFLIILGYSGSGKSTLLNMIGGIDKVNEGEIIYKGHDITKFKDKQLTEYRKNAIGYIFQFFNLLSDITIYQNIVLAPSSTKDKAEIERILDGVGLLDKKDKFPRQLSGGQQQRASIARALAKSSDMLLADEPTGALDYESGKDVFCQICRWGLDEQTAYEVEATLIDILPGLTNIQNGHNHERGLINAEDLESKFNLSEYEEPQEKYVIIKVTEASVDRNGGLYEATRKSWCANLDKAKEYKYVLSVIYGVVQEVYEVKNWNYSSGSKRIEFEGQVCQKQSLLALKNKMIPEVYRLKGAANPFMYKKQ